MSTLVDGSCKHEPLDTDYRLFFCDVLQMSNPMGLTAVLIVVYKRNFIIAKVLLRNKTYSVKVLDKNIN